MVVGLLQGPILSPVLFNVHIMICSTIEREAEGAEYLCEKDKQFAVCQ